jgi:hypothetical protein
MLGRRVSLLAGVTVERLTRVGMVALVRSG